MIFQHPITTVYSIHVVKISYTQTYWLKSVYIMKHIPHNNKGKYSLYRISTYIFVRKTKKENMDHCDADGLLNFCAYRYQLPTVPIYMHT